MPRVKATTTTTAAQSKRGVAVWEMECKYDWVITEPEVWEVRISYWMPQWYDCLDTCTGATFKIGLPDQFVR